MQKKTKKNNSVTLVGKVTSELTYHYEEKGEKFYSFTLSTKRHSSVVDTIPILVSEYLMDPTQDYRGETVKIQGEFRSYNNRVDGKSKLKLNVTAMEIGLEDQVIEDDTNWIYMDGFVCKKPIYRQTPLGREIADVLLAVPKPDGKSNYIPCICWGGNAQFAGTLSVGSEVQVWGRIQSREYKKVLDNEHSEMRVAYEVSISKISEVKKKEEKQD